MMTAYRELNLSVLLKTEHDDVDGSQWWVARCLEHEIVIQARSIGDALYEMVRTICGRLITAQQFGVDAFADTPRASEELWREFNEGWKVDRGDKRHRFEGPMSVQPRLDARVV